MRVTKTNAGTLISMEVPQYESGRAITARYGGSMRVRNPWHTFLRTVACLAVLGILGLIFACIPAHSAPQTGFYIRSSKTEITSPVAGKSWCFQPDGKFFQYNTSGSWERKSYPQFQLVGIGAPTADNDTTQGYEPGSIWYDSSNKEMYVCTDASEGAAVWSKFSNISSGPVSPHLSTMTSFTLDGASSLHGGAAGGDNNLWIADGASVWKVTTLGYATKYTLSNTPTPIITGLTADNVGNLWAADSNGFVWKIALDGSSTKYELTGSSPAGITFCNGKLWVSDNNGAVWEVTTDGEPTSHAMVGTTSLWTIVAHGTDVLIIDAGVDQIYKVATGDASSTTYEITGCGPIGAAIGGDGFLWVTSSDGKIYRVNTSNGEFTSFTFPAETGGTAYCMGLTLGSDSNLYAADYLGAMWQITPAGEFTRFPVSGSTAPSGCLTGSDGNIYVTDGGTIWKCILVH